MDSEAPKRPKPPLRTKAPGRRAEVGNHHNMSSGLNKRDLSTEYISSIVDRVPIPAPDDDDDNEFEVQQYTQRGVSPEGDRPGGELVIDEKPHFDSVSY